MRNRTEFVTIAFIIVVDAYRKNIEPVEKKWPELERVRLYNIRGTLYCREGFARLDELKSQGSTKCLAEIREANHAGIQPASDPAR